MMNLFLGLFNERCDLDEKEELQFYIIIVTMLLIFLGCIMFI